MRRPSHDLPGTMQRVAKLRDELMFAVTEVKTVWKDDKARAYLQQYTSDIPPTVNQLVATLSETIELFENIAKKVQDPDTA
ncbi:MAG: hypothetical protein R3C53_15840 [Pirellulaceae bacterium]